MVISSKYHYFIIIFEIFLRFYMYTDIQEGQVIHLLKITSSATSRLHSTPRTGLHDNNILYERLLHLFSPKFSWWFFWYRRRTLMPHMPCDSKWKYFRKNDPTMSMYWLVELCKWLYKKLIFNISTIMIQIVYLLCRFILAV